MTRRFGNTPPEGGVSLHEAALTLTSSDARNEYADTRKTWESAGKPQRTPSLVRRTDMFGERHIDERSVTHPLLRTYDQAHKALLREARGMLESGELQAIAIELGLAEAEYVELLPLHWQALTIKNWQKSIVYRQFGSGSRLHVVVYGRDKFSSANLSTAGHPGPRGERKQTPTLADKIRDTYGSAPASISGRWKTRAAAARWVRKQVDGKGAEVESRRYVLTVLKDEFDLRFAGSPDGKSEK